MCICIQKYHRLTLKVLRRKRSFKITIMEICKAPTLRLKALNKHRIIHIMYSEMENNINNEKKKNEKKNEKKRRKKRSMR